MLGADLLLGKQTTTTTIIRATQSNDTLSI
jgi:hypothetical protein